MAGTQAGVYHCLWGTDEVRVIVASELPREKHNAMLHLFTTSPELLGFGWSRFRPRSKRTSTVLKQLYESFQREGVIMPYTMSDFIVAFLQKEYQKATPDERQDFLNSLPTEERLANLNPAEIRQYLDRLESQSGHPRRKPRKKK